MVTFVSLTLGRQQFHPVNTRLLAGFGVTFLIVIAEGGLSVVHQQVTISVAFAAGLYLSVGYEFNMISTVASFLLLAIGVDDVFVLVNAFEEIAASNQRLGQVIHGCFHHTIMTCFPGA